MSLFRAWIAPVASLAIVAGAIGVADATGAWVTSGRQVITAGTAMSVDDLKGWMTLQQAADGLGLPVSEVIVLLGAPTGVALGSGTAFKDLESLVPGFELTAFREVLRVRVAGADPSPVEPAGESGEGSVTGQSTLRSVATAAGIDPAALARECGLPAGVDLDATLRSLRSSHPDLELDDVRDAVARLA